MTIAGGKRHAGGAWWLVAVLTAVATVSYIDRLLLNLLIDPVKRGLMVTDTQIGLVQGFGFTSAYVLASPVCGQWADRMNRRRLLLGAGVAWGAVTALTAFVTGFWTLLLCRLAVGAMEAMVQPVAWSLLSDRFAPERLPRAMSVFLMAPYIGGGLALVFGGAVIGSTAAVDRLAPALAAMEAWRQVFFIIGLVGVAIAMLLLLVREPTRKGIDGAAAQAEPAPSLRQTLAFFWSQRAFFGHFYAAMGGIIVVLYAVPAWLPVYAVRHFHVPLASVGLQYGPLVLVAGILGVLSGPQLVRMLERRGVTGAILVTIAAIAAALVPAAALLPLAGSYREVLVLGTVLTFLFSLPQALGTSVLQIVTPPRMRGLSTAIYVIVASLTGLGAGPLAVALFTDHVFGDPQKVGWSLGLVCFASAVTACWQATRAISPYRPLRADGALDAARAGG